MRQKMKNLRDEALLEIAQSFLQGLKAGYLNAIKTKYSLLREENSDIFPLVKLDKYLNFNLIILNDNFFSYCYQIVILDNADNKVIDKSKDESVKGNIDFIDTTGNFDEVKYLNSLYPKKLNIFHEIFTLHGIDRTLGNLNKESLEYRVRNIYNDGLQYGDMYAGYHFVQFNKEMNTPMNKQESKPSIFNIHRVDDMIKAVGDEDFEYQMQEAISVFEYQHYLPAAATFCVAIETLLIIFKRRNGLKHKSSDSSIIKDLVDELSSKKN